MTTLEITFAADVTPDLRLGWLSADLGGPPDHAALDAEIQRALAIAPPDDEATRTAIRRLLKAGGFKATGRNKPASEYLRNAPEFPRISPAVDINNLLSRETGWPMSVLDRARAVPEGRAEVRLGQPDERYEFNSAGHSLKLHRLLSVGSPGGPLVGNPVKDAMLAKVTGTTRTLVVFVWTSAAAANDGAVCGLLARYGELLTRCAGAEVLGSGVASPG